MKRAVLLGSYVEGRRDLATDLDLLVVMESDMDFASRTAWLYRRLDPNVDVDLLAYGPAKMSRMAERPNGPSIPVSR